ncbi:MAG: AzlD domain-containing protein [Desulfuromonadales bacterium]|nr:AzlD domain-containing protein [Desulfuromonadales bacterium]
MRLDPSAIWLIMLSIGAGTFLIRFSFIWFFGQGKVRPGIQRVLRLVPAAVLSALILPSFIFSQQANFSVANHRMWAGLVAAIIASRSRNVLLTISAGMGTLWLCSYLWPS